MKLVGPGLLLLAALAAGAPDASAAIPSINATLTADNHYALYYGKADGSNLEFVGRNETGTPGSEGDWNWSAPESWDFSTPDYIYVAAWDDGGPEGWIGDFQITRSDLSTQTLLTNDADWESYVVDGYNSNPGEYGDLAIATVADDIEGADWDERQSESAANSDSPWPWGNIAAIDGEAKWIWDASGEYSDSYYVLFRSGPIDLDEAAVPEPATLAIWSIFGAGAAGAAAARRRRRGRWSNSDRRAIYGLIK